MSAEFHLPEAMTRIAREHGKSRFAQVVDMARLALPPHRLSPLEYYSLRLYDDARYPWPEKTRFIGHRSKWYRRLRHRDWYGIAEDKLLFYAALRGHGEAVPETYALYHKDGRRYAHAATFRERSDLAAHLRNDMPYPCFGKPVAGTYGQGASYLSAYDAADDRLVMRHGERKPVDDFVRELIDPYGMGYLLQQPLRPHPDYQTLCGNHLPSLRLDIFWGENEPRAVYAHMLIPAGRNIISNLQGGRLGNLYGLVDLDSGRMEAVLTRCTWRSIMPIERHPDTGAQVHGEAFPRFHELVAYGLKLAPLFPGLRLQSWDLCYTDQGPRALELNLGGDSLFMAQRMTGRPFLDDEIRAYAQSRRIT